MSDLRPGARLADRYRVEARIGEGAHGSVYRALDERSGARVAIKYLHASQRASPVGVQRFEREARYLLALDHPKIVRALDFGYADGVPYLACELLDGLSLRDLLKTSGALPVPVAVAITLDVLDALGAAHAAGIIHRDVKPGNIFLPRPGVAGPARVIDFGIARALERDGAEHLTLTGEALGTPAYIAPEQAYGHEVRETADIYALGLTLAEMVGGQRVVSGSSELTLLVLQASDTPHALNDRVLGSPLAAVTARAIAKKPEARFRSAAEMRAAVLAAAPPARRAQTLLVIAHTRELTLVDAPPTVPMAMAATSLAPSFHGAGPTRPSATEAGAPLATSRLAPAPRLASPIIPAPPIPRRRARGGGPLPFIVAAIVGAAALGAGLYFAVRTPDDARRAPRAGRPTARVRDEPPRPDEPSDPDEPQRLDPRHAAGFADIDVEELEQRIRGAGYAIDGREDFGAGPLSSMNVEVRAHRGAARAVVTCTRYLDEETVDTWLSASEIDGFAARRDGMVVIAVRVDDDPSATRELLDDVAAFGAAP